jgi:hypothetical protein
MEISPKYFTLQKIQSIVTYLKGENSRLGHKMIISASRRTDIPAFYADWFINRIREGFCMVPNPFNRKQVSRVSLLAKDVDIIVFWTRNPKPMIQYLEELDQRGYMYYFQYTVLDNPRVIDPKSPDLQFSLNTFQKLAQRVGPDRVIWRYDPIVLSDITPTSFHDQVFSKIATELCGSTHSCVISIMDPYVKSLRRLSNLKQIKLSDSLMINDALDSLIPAMKMTARSNNINLVSCAEEIDLHGRGVLPGKCIDNVLIKNLIGKPVTSKKDSSQRKECGCVKSKDIGIYNTCINRCQYCYATSDFVSADAQHRDHDSKSPSMVGNYGSTPNIDPLDPGNGGSHETQQLELYKNDV